LEIILAGSLVLIPGRQEHIYAVRGINNALESLLFLGSSTWHNARDVVIAPGG
jgi:hypothetical protein